MQNRKWFMDAVQKNIDELKRILESKGTAYSGDEDFFRNFKQIASETNTTPEKVWYVYFSKHLDALRTYLKGDYRDSEPISGRINDLINYLLLLNAHLTEQEEGKFASKQ